MTGVEHPAWCAPESCTAQAGGVHAGRVRLVPAQSPTRGALLSVGLVQKAGGPPQIEITGPDRRPTLSLSLEGARRLADIVKTVAHEGRRAER